MAEDIELKPGECVDSVSYDKKVRSDAVWNHTKNDTIKTGRENRNVMMEKDPLYIPDPEIVWYNDKKTALTHIFKLEPPTREFRFQVLRGAALKGYKYELTIDGKAIPDSEIKPDPMDDTWQTCQIIPNSKVAEITLHYPVGKPGALTVEKEHKYKINLGYLRPVDKPEGEEDRLKNLGFMRDLPNRGDDKVTRGAPDAKKALDLFQTSNGIDPKDKDVISLTIGKLKELTGDPA